MSNWHQIILTSIITIIGGVSIFCLGQIILKFFIEPIQDLDQCRGKTCDILIFHRNIYLNPNSASEDKMKEISKEIRGLAVMLLAKKSMIRGYNFFEKINMITTQENILIAHRNLIGLSNSIHKIEPINVQRTIKENKKREKNIKISLNIDF